MKGIILQQKQISSSDNPLNSSPVFFGPEGDIISLLTEGIRLNEAGRKLEEAKKYCFSDEFWDEELSDEENIKRVNKYLHPFRQEVHSC